MKHKLVDDVNVNVDLPTQDLEDLVTTVVDGAIKVIGFYMVADTLRHIFKAGVKS